MTRPNTKSTEAESMARAECDIWGRTKLVKTFYGYVPDHLAHFGFLYVKDDSGAQQQVMDINTPGLNHMVTSKDERYTVQTYTAKGGSGNTIHAIAFSVDGTIIRVIQPEPEILQKCVVPTKSAGCAAWPRDPDAVLGTWANHPMRIRIGDKEYSQADLPMTIPGTNIELSQHKFNMFRQGTAPPVELQSGLIIDNKDGFLGRLQVVTSNGDALWMNVNIKFAPDNIPDPWQDSLCGRGPAATPIGTEPIDLHDYANDWDKSMFTANDQQDICYADTRLFGAPNIVADPPYCPGVRDVNWVTRNGIVKGQDGRMDHLWRNGWGEPVGYTPRQGRPGEPGDGQCNMSPELKELAWSKIEEYALKTLTWGYVFCSQPKREPSPTPEEMCAKNKCELRVGEDICESLKGSEGDADQQEGGVYEDCLLEYCAECLEEEAKEFVAEIEEQFPAKEDDDDDEA